MNAILPNKLTVGWGDDRGLIIHLITIGSSNMEIQQKMVLQEVNVVSDKIKKYNNGNPDKIDDLEAFSMFANYGLLMEALRNFNQAVEGYSKALKIQPNSNDAYNRILSCLIVLRKYDQVIALSEKLISIDKELHYPYSKIIDSYNRQNRMPEALSVAKRLIEATPKKSFPYLKNGEIYEINKNLDEALVQYEKALEIEPTAIAYAKCADIYERLRTYTKSLELHKKGLEIEPMFEYSRNKLPIIEHLIAEEEKKKVRVTTGG